MDIVKVSLTLTGKVYMAYLWLTPSKRIYGVSLNILYSDVRKQLYIKLFKGQGCVCKILCSLQEPMFSLACSVTGVHLSELYLFVRYYVVTDDLAVSTDAVLFLSFVCLTARWSHLILYYVFSYLYLFSWLVGWFVCWFTHWLVG